MYILEVQIIFCVIIGCMMSNFTSLSSSTFHTSSFIMDNWASSLLNQIRTFLPSESCPLYSHLLELKYQAPPMWELHREFWGLYFDFGFLFPKDGFQKCKISTIKEISVSKYQATRMLNDLSHSLMLRQYWWLINYRCWLLIPLMTSPSCFVLRL